MKRTTTTMLQATRWLVVLVVAMFVASGNVFASAASRGKAPCTEVCGKQCPCCIRSAPAEPSAPLAPTPSTRTTVAKDFQFVTFCHALLMKECASAAIITPQISTPHFSTSIPVFVRHCSFLI